MERTAAIKKLEKILGPTFGYRVDAKAPSPEDRAAARQALISAIDERNILNARSTERQRAILAADNEYQTLLINYLAAKKEVERLSYITRRFKITVGTSEGSFFLVKADGDSWEEIINKLSTENRKS